MSKLTVKNLSFGYDNNKLFSNLNFNVPSGSFISIIGPNGSGKSSLAQILVGKIKTNNVYIDEMNLFLRKLVIFPLIMILILIMFMIILLLL